MRFIGQLVKNYILSLLIGLLFLIVSIVSLILMEKYGMHSMMPEKGSVDLLDLSSDLVFFTFAFLQGISLGELDKKVSVKK